jgi:hypothetical protein
MDITGKAIWITGSSPCINDKNVNILESGETILTLSEQLLYNVKMGTDTLPIERALELTDNSTLIKELLTDNSKKAFWINIYNAFFQILSIREKQVKPAVFKTKTINIAGTKFSLDEIEHGILRKYRWKYSLGYLPQIFPSKKIKQLAVASIDYRIHFALNCGAKSCPPIAFYNADRIDKQLDLATQSFLESETSIDEEKKVVSVSKLMLWFKADFGDNKGIHEMLKKYLKKDLQFYAIRYSNYDWDQSLQNFAG